MKDTLVIIFVLAGLNIGTTQLSNFFQVNITNNLSNSLCFSYKQEVQHCANARDFFNLISTKTIFLKYHIKVKFTPLNLFNRAINFNQFFKP